MRQVKPRRDPAPSVLKYRLQRLWLTPSFRRLVKFGPATLVVLGLGTYLVRSDAVHEAFVETSFDIRDAFVSRHEFQVTGVQISGASEKLREAVNEIVDLDFPISSLDINVAQLRDEIEALPMVSTAAVRVGSGGKLNVDLSERVPAVLWRTGGVTSMLDKSGVVLGQVASRLARPDLPLILGKGAGEEVAEAVELFAIASPILERVRGMQRIGSRRWNLVLDRDQQILLPQEGALDALRRIIEIDAQEHLLDRDITVLDMRDVKKPVLRLGAFASSHIRPQIGTEGAGQ